MDPALDCVVVTRDVPGRAANVVAVAALVSAYKLPCPLGQAPLEKGSDGGSKSQFVYPACSNFFTCHFIVHDQQCESQFVSLPEAPVPCTLRPDALHGGAG